MDGSPQELPPESQSVGAARRLVRDHLAQHLSDERLDAALLVVSELASNAVSHAQTPFTVDVSLHDRVRIEVSDRDATLPEAGSASPLDDHGRGLALVDALADRWGVEQRRGGKTVWCEL